MTAYKEKRKTTLHGHTNDKFSAVLPKLFNTGFPSLNQICTNKQFKDAAFLPKQPLKRTN